MNDRRLPSPDEQRMFRWRAASLRIFAAAVAEHVRREGLELHRVDHEEIALISSAAWHAARIHLETEPDACRKLEHQLPDPAKRPPPPPRN